VVHGLARLYLKRHLTGIEGSSGANHLKERLRVLEKALEDRMDWLYPASVYTPNEGGLSEDLRRHVEDNLERWKKRGVPAPDIELKNQTMADAPRDINELFQDLRPLGVVAERDSGILTEYSDQVKSALEKHSNLDIQVGTKFEDQFVGPYLSRIFPWALNYETGGPDYPDFFAPEANEEGDYDLASLKGKKRYRREAPHASLLDPPRHAKNLARRIEVQIAGDWSVVPAAHNLTMRYNSLKHSYLSCRRNCPPDRPLAENASILIKAVEKVFESLHKGVYEAHGSKRPINGDITKLKYADGIDNEERQLVDSYNLVTRKVAGSQTLRPRIGHCMFGYRVNHGEGTFYTFSPSTRHSSLLHRLQRARENDSSLHGDNPNGLTPLRRRLAGAAQPALKLPDGVPACDAADHCELPPLHMRQALNVKRGRCMEAGCPLNPG